MTRAHVPAGDLIFSLAGAIKKIGQGTQIAAFVLAFSTEPNFLQFLSFWTVENTLSMASTNLTEFVISYTVLTKQHCF